MIENRRVKFIADLTENQKLATETCPNFSNCVERARGDYYEIKRCQKPGCPVEVKFTPHVNVLKVRGSCPKL